MLSIASIPLDETRFLKLLLREATQKSNTSISSTGIIFGTPFDSIDYALAWSLKRDCFLYAAGLLGIKPQVLGQIPWIPDIFDESATLQRHLLALIRSEVQKIYLAKVDAVVDSFISPLSSYLSIAIKWNGLKPKSPLLYPPYTWTTASNPPVIFRFNIATPWPNGTAAGTDPPDFDPADPNSFLALDQANFDYAVSKYGILPELIPLRGKIFDLAHTMASNATAKWTAITPASPFQVIEDAAHQLSIYNKAVLSTRLDRTEHSAAKIADVILLSHAASLFSIKLGPLVQPFISSLIDKKEYAQAFALLDAKFLNLTHCHKVATILRHALGLPSTYSHCVNVEDTLNTFYVLISRLEYLIHLHDNTPTANRPSLSQIEQSCLLSELDWSSNFPLFHRKVTALETRCFLLDAFRGGLYEDQVREISIDKGLQWTMPQIVAELISLQAYDNKHRPKSLSHSHIRTPSGVFGDDEDINVLFRQIVSDPTLHTFHQAVLPPPPSSIASSHSSLTFASSWPTNPPSFYHTHNQSITAQSTRRQSKRCVICSSGPNPKRANISHTHNAIDCNTLESLSTMDDQALSAASYRPAAELGLPPYSTLYQHQLASQSSSGWCSSGNAKRKQGDDESVVTKADLQRLKDELRSLSRQT